MKAFMKKWQANKTKQFRLHSLLRIYSLVMIAIISSFALLLAYADWDAREKEADRVGQRVLARTISEVEYYYRESARLAQALVENQARIEGIYKYLVSVHQIISTGSWNVRHRHIFQCLFMKISMISMYVMTL